MYYQAEEDAESIRGCSPLVLLLMFWAFALVLIAIRVSRKEVSAVESIRVRESIEKPEPANIQNTKDE